MQNYETVCKQVIISVNVSVGDFLERATDVEFEK